MRLAIASGKGGTGKTFVAVNLFQALKESGRDVILADCDAEAPNAASYFALEPAGSEEVCQQVPVINRDSCTWCGKCHEYCHYNAIFILPPMKIIQVMEELCHGCGACSEACEFGAITEKPVPLGRISRYSFDGKECFLEASMNTGNMSPVKVIKAAVRRTGEYKGTVILDAPPGTSCPFIHTVAKADFVILVTEPTPFGLSDLRQSVETLRLMEKPFGVLLNKTGIGDDRVQCYLEEEGIGLLMEIPFDRDLAKIYSGGGLAGEAFPRLKQGLTDMFMELEDAWK